MLGIGTGDVERTRPISVVSMVGLGLDFEDPEGRVELEEPRRGS